MNQSFQAAHRSLEIKRVYPGSEFISTQKLTDITRGLGLSVHFQEENIIEKFKSVWEFLMSVKKTGANNASNGNNILIHRRLMLAMMDFYKNSFEQFGQIPATYHIIYGRHKKPLNSAWRHGGKRLLGIDAVLEVLPEDMDKEHPEQLKAVRSIIQLIISLRKSKIFLEDSVSKGMLSYF